MIITNIEITTEAEVTMFASVSNYYVTLRLGSLKDVELHNLRQMLGHEVDIVATRNDLPPYEFKGTQTFQKPIESEPRKIVNAIQELEL